MSNFIQRITVTNLATHTLVIPTTDIYSFDGTLELPAIVPSATQGPGGGAGTGTGGGAQVTSQVVVTINQNGSPIYTSHPGDKGFLLKAVSCVANDVITIVRTSSLLQDEQKNAIKMTLAITEGAS
jgi:hypothetical protein